MADVIWTIEPIDTWFLRQGIPYDLGQHVSSTDVVFPPHMTTLQGAIRSAIARKQGWTPGNDSKWPELLGSADDLGHLSLEGVFLKKGEKLLFPVPRHLMKSPTGDIIRLKPGEVVQSDMGHCALPELERRMAGEDKVTAFGEAYISYDGLCQCLQGRRPSAETIVPSHQLWHVEIRTGIALNDETKIAEPGLLYEAAHIRLEKDVALVVGVKGIPWDWQKGIRAMPFGGERRFARVGLSQEPLTLPPLAVDPRTDRDVRVMAILLTPGLFADPQKVLKHGPFLEPCLSAVTERVAMRGGWDLKRKMPRPLRPFVPAGSVWFYRLSLSQWNTLRVLHGQNVGLEREYGFGQIIFGQWEE